MEKWNHRDLKQYETLKESVLRKGEIRKEEFQTCLSNYLTKIKRQTNSSREKNTHKKIPHFLDGVFDFSGISESIDYIKYVNDNLSQFSNYLCSIDISTTYKEDLEVLREENMDEYVLKLFSQSKSQFDSYTTVSILCSIIERLLISVLVHTYKVKFSKNAILSEILVHKKIIELFKDDPNFLELIIHVVGSPKGINLRNIIFHGFLCVENEYNPNYTSVIILILLSLLRTIKKRKKIPSKWHWINIDEKLIKNSTTKRHHEKITQNEIQTLIAQSFFPLTHRKKFLSYSISLFFSKKYYKFLVTILPQFEHFLRRQFIICNKKNERYFLAQSKELFTTLDVLLNYAQKNNQTNKYEKNMMYDHIGTREYLTLLEFFVFENGYKIRDLIAHFKVLPTSPQNQRIIKQYSILIFSLVIHFLNKFSISSSSSLMTLLQTQNFVEAYKFQFHPFVLVTKKYWETFKSFEQIEGQLKAITLDANLLNCKEISHYSCFFDKKNFYYKKNEEGEEDERGDKNKNKKGKMDVSDILQKLKDAEEKVKCKKNLKEEDTFFGGQSKNIEQINVKEEKLNVSIKQRREILNNVGMVLKILNGIEKIIEALREKKLHFSRIMTEKKARTKQRKTFGVILKTEEICFKIIRYQFLVLNRELSENYETMDNLQSSHKWFSKLLTFDLRMISGINTGSYGKSIMEFFNVLRKYL